MQVTNGNDTDAKICAAKRSLGRVRMLSDRKSAFEAVISECADGLRGIDYTIEAVSGSSHVHDVADQAARLHELMENYSTILAEWIAAVDDACSCIGKMECGKHARLIAMRYICGKKWTDICSEMGYSYSRIMALRNEALASYYDCMPAEDKLLRKTVQKSSSKPDKVQ